MTPPNRHGPNKLTNYLETHETVIRQYVSRGIVLSDGLTFTAAGDGQFTMIGTLRCIGGIEIEVRKLLEIVDGEGGEVRVRNVAYSYNVKLTGVANIVRYDSPHDHRPCHHKHRFDTFAPNAPESIVESGDGDWPTLGQVIAEVEEWYYTNVDRISQRGHS